MSVGADPRGDAARQEDRRRTAALRAADRDRRDDDRGRCDREGDQSRADARRLRTLTQFLLRAVRSVRLQADRRSPAKAGHYAPHGDYAYTETEAAAAGSPERGAQPCRHRRPIARRRPPRLLRLPRLHTNRSTFSRRELLAGAGAGAAALASRAQRPPGAGAAGRRPSSSPTHRRERRRRAGRRGARGRGRQDRGDRSDRRDPQDVSRRRGLRRTRQGAAPGPDQLPRAHGGGPRARLQRRLRISQLRASGRSAREPSPGRRGHADGHRRRARSDPDRDHDDRRERRRHQPLTPRRWRRPACAACSRSRSATARTWPARCRRRASPGASRRRFSARLRDEGLQRINDLFTTWHGAKQGRISVFPAAALAETSSPELLQAVRAFAEKHDLGYTIHLSQSRRRSRLHGAPPRRASAGVSRPSTASSARGCSRRTAATSTTPTSRCSAAPARSFRTRRTMAANRGVIPPIAEAARGGLPDRERHRQQHQRSVRGDEGRAADRAHLAQRRDSRACGRSRKTCSKTPRKAAREPCSRSGARLARGRQEGRPHRARHAARAPRAGRAHPVRRGFTTVSRPTSSRAWSTASSSCATARF